MFLSWDMLLFFTIGCLYWVRRIWMYKFSKNIEVKCPHCGGIFNIPPENQKDFEGLKRNGFLE